MANFAGVRGAYAFGPSSGSVVAGGGLSAYLTRVGWADEREMPIGAFARHSVQNLTISS